MTSDRRRQSGEIAVLTEFFTGKRANYGKEIASW